MAEPTYVSVETWCGFETLHPPHLFGEVMWGRSGPYLLVSPCPGRPFEDVDDDE